MYVFIHNVEANYKHDYERIAADLNEWVDTEPEKFKKTVRTMAQNDLFFLLYFVLNIVDINHPWLVDRISEVEELHNRTLDLWAREHFKSTIITFGLTVQKVLQNPENRIAIFSNTKSMATKFVKRIRKEFTNNKLLHACWPDIFYDNPENQRGITWAENKIEVKRKGNFNEMTVEAHGVTEQMPTGSHFTIRIYDDLVTEDTVSSGEMIKKTEKGFRISHNLGVTKGYSEVRIIGTRYDYNDLYSVLIKSNDWNVRSYPGDKPPAFWDDEILEQKRKDMGKYVFGTQISLKPLTEGEQKFEMKWLKYYKTAPFCNKYILVDPANEKKKDSSYTVMMVIGVDCNNNFFWLDGVRDKLNLGERWIALRNLYKKSIEDGEEVQQIGYEKYSMQGDVPYIEEKQDTEMYHFKSDFVTLGGNMTKNDRIRTLVPLYQYGRFYVPEELWVKDIEGKSRDLVKEFVEEEYKHFPSVKFKDMLDCMARITDSKIDIVCPDDGKEKQSRKNKISVLGFNPLEQTPPLSDWMGS